jgi:hypothetical protein
VPGAVLQLGPRHPDAVAWLAAHWGITDRLRQVVIRDEATIRVFVSASVCRSVRILAVTTLSLT